MKDHFARGTCGVRNVCVELGCSWVVLAREAVRRNWRKVIRRPVVRSDLEGVSKAAFSII